MDIISSNFQLKTWYVVMRDGTIQELRAGCFKLTSDGQWTFYREAVLPKLGGHVLHSIYGNSVKGIYSSDNVVLEVKRDMAIKGNLTSEVRKKTEKKPTTPKPTKASL